VLKAAETGASCRKARRDSALVHGCFSHCKSSTSGLGGSPKLVIGSPPMAVGAGETGRPRPRPARWLASAPRVISSQSGQVKGSSFAEQDLAASVSSGTKSVMDLCQ
jgi:hypothetical protein